MSQVSPPSKKSNRNNNLKSSKTKRELSFAELSFGHRYKNIIWIGGLVAITLYSFFFYKYFISPYTTRWRALYGEIEYPKGYSIHGIDVSHHQGKIDWEKVARAKVANEPLEFVIIKATEGKSILDRRFKENFEQARKMGIIRGAYHFFSPNISGDVQAHYYMSKVKLEKGDLPPVLDIEKNGKLKTERLQQEVLEWLQILEKKYEVRPIIYTGLKFKETYLNNPIFDNYPFWIAHYYVHQIGYKGKWKFWQHTDIGSVDGINNDVDLNVYNGSMYELRKLTIK